MKKFVFGVFTLLAVGLFTNPLFAKYCEKVPECASGCSFMQSCFSVGGRLDIYRCGSSYAAVSRNNNCQNCLWNVKMEGGEFIVGNYTC